MGGWVDGQVGGCVCGCGWVGENMDGKVGGGVGGWMRTNVGTEGGRLDE